MSKKIITLLAIFIGVSTTNGQSIESVRMAFTQTLFPKKVLPDNVKTYSCTITTPYLKDDSTFRQIAEDKYQAELKNYPNKVKDAQKEYDEVTLKEYDKSVAGAKEKYKLESDEFNKMSKLEKLALIDKRPTLNIPPKPVFVNPPLPYVQSINTGDVIIMDPEVLTKNYIKISGFAPANDGLKIKIDFKPFEWVEPVAAIVDVENYNPQTREKFITKQTQFVTKYRQPATLEIKLNNEVLKTGVYAETGTYQILTTGSKPNRLSIERPLAENTLTNMNNYLNETYGYPKITRNVVLFYVKNKKGEYDDVEKAKDFAVSGYKNYAANTEAAVEDIDNAISIWEKVISEVNYDDSKARIDEKVGTAILKNLIFATIVTNEFEKADKYMGDFRKLRLNYDDKQFLTTHESMYNDLKARFSGK
ncbi:MAG: hypothetical protein ABIQ27_08920 [Flavobacterium sp.]|uniref:hypothetical protein n=1 Tax=Flavobacterium sp. TaxID=239 RepID=UPI0032676EC0